jgi:ABC-type multidrug transport system ATPase subunit
MLGIFGHNSSGKTSLFNIIIDRLSLTSGNITYFGKDKSLLNWKDKLSFGYCPQIDNLDTSLTYEQNARVIGKMKGLTHD